MKKSLNSLLASGLLLACTGLANSAAAADSPGMASLKETGEHTLPGFVDYSFLPAESLEQALAHIKN